MTRLQQAIKKEKVDQVPIWFMRQAGRYLPEYHKAKEGKDFLQMVKDPELAAEVTLQPIERFDLDAAIIFSDILVILEAMGIRISFATGAPELLDTVEDAETLEKVIADYRKERIPEILDYYRQAIEITRKNLSPDKSLFGFAAAPFTLASYMIEGQTSKTHAKARAWMYSNPQGFARMMDFIADVTIDYLRYQIAAGVDVIQLFDSWGDAMGPEVYRTYIMPHIAKIATAISKEVPVTFFCRGASIQREALLPLYSQGVSVISLDWRISIDAFGDYPVQGNMDPAFLLSDPETVQAEVRSILEKRGHKPGFIFNLGHGIYPEAKIECVEAMVQTVKDFRP